MRRNKILTVCLKEYLQVRQSPLEENQVWAILYTGAKKLQRKLSLEEETSSYYVPPVTPDTMCIKKTGNIEIFKDQNLEKIDDFLPPECNGSPSNNVENYEKVLVYSLGMTAYNSADYGLNESQVE